MISQVASDPGFATRAVLRLSAIEFWERYSYFTLFALLALFVSAPVASGGLGWRNGETLRFFGVYLLAVQASPVIGGLIADRWLDKRVALALGAGALLIGHTLLATAAAVPWFTSDGAGRSMLVAASQAGAELGLWVPDPRLPPGLAGADRAISLCFYAAVGLVAIGNGLFKPILSVVIGRLPHSSETARNAAFTSFFLYINCGGLLSVILGGWLAQRFGWAWAFGGSAIGMIVSIGTLALLQRTYIRPFLDHKEATSIIGAGTPPPRNFLVPMLVLLGLLVVSASFSYQSYGFISLFTAQRVARTVGGMAIPTTWFTALNPITIMVMSPILLSLWRRGWAGARWTTVQYIAGALTLMGLGFLPLVGATLQAGPQGLANPLWVVATIMMIAVSELLYSPAAMSAATRLAPPRLQTLAIGSQGAAIGLGSWISGQLGAIAFEQDKVVVMSCMAAAALTAGVALFASSRVFARFRL
jgi:POT family proton-dependent oligopeptide transporter